jgi:hypothetical protein
MHARLQINETVAQRRPRYKRSVPTVVRVLAGTAVVAGLLVSPAADVAARDNDQLAAVRHATAEFHDVSKAEAAGYGKLLACFDRPGVGGMGQHYVKGSLVDGTATPTKPQALVYEVDGDELNLVAVEYIIPYSFVPPTAAPPRLFGQAFHHNDALSLWALHAWIWRQNPLGMFADYNPRVDLCPGHEPGSQD